MSTSKIAVAVFDVFIYTPLNDSSHVGQMMKFFLYFVFASLVALPCCSAFGQDSAASFEQIRERAAKMKHIQRDVDIDLIDDAEIPLCGLVISDDKRQMTLLSPQKVVLRFFADTTGKPGRNVDQFSYYQNGVEVYREMDTQGNLKRDQFRWLNSAGTRWGVDTDDDSLIDEWKEISAEEVSREIVLALATKDARRFLCVALKEGELESLALGTTPQNTVTKKVAALKTGFAAAAAAVALSQDAEWYQLSAAMPGIVPKGEQGNQKDLHIYENAAVTISDGGTVRQIVIGTLVKIGENNWRVLDLPRNYDEEQVSYTFIQPVHAQGSSGPTDNDVVTVMNQIAALQAQIPTLPAQQRPEKHKQVISLLLEIVAKATTQEEKENWTRQIADTILEAVSRDELPDGKEQIAKVFEAANKPSMPELAAHVRSRQIMVEYHLAFASSDDTTKMKAYTDWLTALEELVTLFPKTEAGLEGMMQLASYKETPGQSNEESVKWYNKVIELVPGQPYAAKAQGAIRRLTAEGMAVPFRTMDTTGKVFDIAEYKGKFVVLCFWDSHSAAQLPVIKAVTDRFEASGLVSIGINLDPDEATLRKSLQGAPPWRQLYAPNGLDGALAVYWGIMTPPCMIVYDKEGKVVRANITTVEDLQFVLTESLE